MTVDVIFPVAQWHGLRQHLFGRVLEAGNHLADEQMALLLAGPNVSTTGTRLIIRELLPAGPTDLVYQSGGGIAPTGEFVATALTRCRQEGWSLIEVHSHPFSMGVSTTFSGIDWGNDRLKMPVLARLLPEGAVHATMVLGPQSLDAHYYDRASGEIRPVHHVLIHGSLGQEHALTAITPTSADRRNDRPFLDADRYSRQVPLLGTGTQAALADSAIVIVGLGGLGSFAVIELAHLGVGKLLLIDPDTVEESNLNRLVGATDNDIGRPKVDVYGQFARAISARAEITTIQASILDSRALAEAKSGDLLLGCVDSHGARLVINQLAVQYAIPFLDAGSGARLGDDQNVTDIGGQVQSVLPGLGCLECRGFIDTRQAAFDLAPPHVRQRELDHGYGTREAAPSVVFLNGVVASLLVAEAVRLLSGKATHSQPGKAPTIILYDLLRQSLMRADAAAMNSCPTCGADGLAGLADLSPLHGAGLPASPPPAVHSAADRRI